MKAKVKLLHGAPSLRGRGRNGVVDDADVALEIKSDREPRVAIQASSLSREGKQDRMPAHFVASFLKLFGLRGVPAVFDAADPNNRVWLDLLAKPVAEFEIYVRLMDGDPGGPPSGARWETFFSSRRAAATQLGRGRIEMLRKQKQHEQPRPPMAAGTRVLPDGAPDPWRESPPDDQSLRPRTKVALTVKLGGLLQRKTEAFVFVFQEVLKDGLREFAPLVPYPGAFGVDMPSTRQALVPALEAVMRIPASDTKWVEIPPKRGPLRSVVVVVTPEALDDAILPRDVEPHVLDGSQLDLLAVRLQQLEAASQPIALLRYEYAVAA